MDGKPNYKKGDYFIYKSSTYNQLLIGRIVNVQYRSLYRNYHYETIKSKNIDFSDWFCEDSYVHENSKLLTELEKAIYGE